MTGENLSARWPWLGLVFLWIFTVGCSDVRLKGLPAPEVNVKSKGHFCISEPEEIKRYTKFLFVIDKSGSNSSNDPGGDKRAGNIEDFIQNNAGQQYYQYGLIVFSGDVSEPYITDDGSTPKFTSNINEALQATNRIRTESDGGTTPYKAALQMARLAVKNDIDENPDEASTYMIFFVSDGTPTDTNSNSELEDGINDILDLEGNIFLSTAYYGDDGSSAQNRLRDMATWGNGKYVNFENNQNWDFNDLVVKPTYEPWQMKNFMVYNLNAGYCLDGSVDVDSDADGMCDKDEIAANEEYADLLAPNEKFDPKNRFSFKDGYGDFFHWRRFKYRETLPQCDDQTDEDHDLLTYCEELYIKNDFPTDGISRHGDPRNPDTDRDGVLDGIETYVYMTRSMAYAMDSTNLLKSNIDGEDQAGKQIAEHRNPLVKDADAIPYDTTLDKDNNPNLDCYGFSQAILPLFQTESVSKPKTLPDLAHKKKENVVLVYYIQTKQSNPNGDGILRFSYQTLLADEPNSVFLDENAGLKVNDSIFRTYATPTRK